MKRDIIPGEAKFRILMETVGAGIAAIDTLGNVTYVNGKICQLSGYSREELLAVAFTDFIHKDDLPQVKEAFLSVMDGTRGGQMMQFRLVQKNGCCIWAYCHPEPIIIDGHIKGICVIINDISDQKQLEKELREREEQLNAYMENAPDSVYMYNLKGILLSVNRKCQELLGYNREEMVGNSFAKLNLIAEGSIARAAELFGDNRKGKGTGPDELAVVTKDGRCVPVEITTSLVQQDGETVALAFMRDISQRKKTESALKESEKRFRRLTENAPDVIYKYRLKPVPGFEYISAAVFKMSGFAPEEYYADPLLAGAMVYPEDSQKFQQHFRSSDSYRVPFVIRWMNKAGQVVWTEESHVPSYDENGKLIAYEGIIRDITARKEAEAALAESEAQYRLLSEHITDTVWLMDMDLNITYQSPSVQRTRGFTPQEIMTMPLEKHFTPDSYQLAAEVFLEEMGKLAADPSYQFKRVLDLEFYRKDGTTIWTECTFSLLRDSNGKPVSILGEGRDITDRRRADIALHESEERWKFALEGSGDGVWDWDAQTNQVYFSHQWKAMLGYADDEIGNTLDDWDRRIHPDDREQTYTELDRHLEGVTPVYVSEHRVLCKDGSYKWILDRGKVISWMPDGKPQRVIGTHSDITERKRADEIVRQSEERFRNMANLLPQTIFELDETGKSTYLNRLGFETFGYSEEEVAAGINVMELLIPEDRDRAMINTSQRILGEDFPPQEYTAIRKDGSKFPVVIYATPIIIDAKTVGMRGMLIDISERLKAEEAIRESERRFKSIVEHVSDIFYIQNADRQIIYVSPQVEKLLGYTVEEVLNSRQYSLTDNPLNLVAEERSMSAINTGEKQEPYALEFMCKDGTKRLCEINESPLKDDQGRVIGIVGAARDITERTLIEAALRESEEKYRMVVENARESIFINVDGMLKFANQRTVELTGYSLEELASRHLIEFIHPDYRRMANERYHQRIKGTVIEEKFTFQGIAKSGSVRWVELTMVPVTWEGKPATLNFMIDITDRKRLEEEQQRVEKLESIGLLAGGIAHDFNNILTAILGNISLARMDTVPYSDIYNNLEIAEKASLRAKGLTQQLLTFSKGGAPVKKLVSLDQIIRDAADSALRSSKIKCQSFMPGDLWQAEIDAGQVGQVIQNLVINAQEAMPAGGDIEIKAENIVLYREQILGSELPLKEGNYIRICVTDHGSGIPADYLDRIFDPFFTTKNKGSGLGLATSFSIARNHGGHLSVESAPGSGSTFYLYLPVSAETGISRKEIEEGLSFSSNARILVMDDEEIVRKTIGRLLKYIGFGNIEFAADGVEAVHLYKTAIELGHPFNLVILDLTVPGGMGGELTIKELLKINPDVRAIVSSGYADEAVIADYRKYGFTGVAAKPYTVEELRNVIQPVLG